ncbi:hypothetical protein Ancab_040379 [Ancistrocladus abbreviatus]
MMSKMSLELSPVSPTLLLLLLLCSRMVPSMVASHSHHQEARVELSNSTFRCIERERQALLHFKQGLVDDHGILTSWGSLDDEHQYHHRDCCQWKGVQCCNSTGHVISLDLRATQCVVEYGYCINGLRGNIGSSLLVLGHLNYLDLSGNDFQKSAIPHFIGSLIRLAYLNLSYSNLGGEIPQQFKNLSNLQTLDLSDNFFLHAKRFAWASTLTSLKTLDLSWVRLTDATDWVHVINSLPSLTHLTLVFCYLPNLSTISLVNSSKSLAYIHLGNNFLSATSVYPWLFNLSFLSHVDLSFNNLQAPVPEAIINLNFLSYLDLSSNQLQGPIPEVIVNLNSLSYMNLSINKLKGPILEAIVNLNSLTYLDLSGNKLQGPMPKAIANLNSLLHLGLSTNQLQGPIPEEIVNLNSLSYLDLSYNQLQGLIPKAIFNLNSLSYLDLSNNQLQGLIPEATVNLSSLSHLGLSNNHLQGPIPKTFVNLISLSYLDLSNNKLQGLIPKGIGSMKSLSYLDLSYNQFAGGVPKSFKHLCRLYELHLNENNLTGDIFSLFQSPSGCIKRSLETLSLEKNNLSGSLPDFSRFQSLAYLNLSYNKLNGSFPSLLNKQSSLKSLSLGNNQITGPFPDDLGQFFELVTLDLSSNFLNGTITEAHLSDLSKLNSLTLDLSFNKLLAFNISPNWATPSKFLDILLLDSCRVGPNFPNWLQTQHDLFYLSISDARISDTLPRWFWGIFDPSSSAYVNLSHNEIRGALPNSGVQNFGVDVLDLSYNSLEGSIPSLLTQVEYLDLSNNKLSGPISSWSLTANATLQFLDVTNNNLSGELPDCWMYINQVEVLNLGNNSFSGNIPNSFGNLTSLVVLDLSHNNFSGEVPLSMKYCTSLQILDLSENLFSKQVPYWFGNNLVMLNVLILRQNEFFGNLPWEICHLRDIQILDLSLNHITGTIPNCLYNSTFLSGEFNSAKTHHNLNNSGWINIDAGDWELDKVVSTTAKIDIHAYLVWKGSRREYWKNLALLRTIDLSSNKLTGEIPYEISFLIELQSLNLSRNYLTGSIPQKFGQLRNLESLDLSKNQLSGEIPTSLSNLNFLSTLDFSYNNLSGKIPSATQLQSFDESTYMGNPYLCGTPLQKKCGEDANQSTHHDIEEAKDRDNEFPSLGLYISIGLGFITGFWGACGILLFKRSWRYAYFRFFNHLYDRIFVLLAVYITRPRAQCQA